MKKYLKIQKFKRGVSPVIAVVLLIALTVAAVAIIYAFTSGLIGNQITTRLVTEKIAVADTNGNELGDLIVLQLRNIGDKNTDLTEITLTRDGAILSSWVLLQNNYSIQAGGVDIISLQTLAGLDEVRSSNEVKVEIKNNQRSITIVDIPIPATLSALPILYDASAGFNNLDIASESWVTYQYVFDHGSLGNGVVVDGDDLLIDTNTDIIFYLQDDTKKVQNGVMTADFLWGDNDGIGIAFRIQDEKNYYWIGYTEDHNGPQNKHGENNNNFDGPIFSFDAQFELHVIVNGQDSLLANSAAPFSLAPGTPQNPAGPYSFRISFSGDTFVFDARSGSTGNYDEIFSVSGDTSITEAGYFGVFSIAADGSRLDNFSVTA